MKINIIWPEKGKFYGKKNNNRTKSQSVKAEKNVFDWLDAIRLASKVLPIVDERLFELFTQLGEWVVLIVEHAGGENGDGGLQGDSR